MYQRFFTSRKVRIGLVFILLFSAAVGIFSFTTPITRKNHAISGLGEETLSQTQALALAIEYYDGSPLYALSRTPIENTTYENLCGLLARTKKMFGYKRVYILYYGIGGKLGILADADYRSTGQPGTDYQPIGTQYDLERYTKKSRTIIESLFEGKTGSAYLPVILEDSTVSSYLPLCSSTGDVVGVLGVDAPLPTTDFAQYGIFDLDVLSMISAAAFLVSLLLLLLCLNKARQENEKNDKGKYYHPSTKLAKKESTFSVDNLDDVDPDDYL